MAEPNQYYGYQGYHNYQYPRQQQQPPLQQYQDQYGHPQGYVQAGSQQQYHHQPQQQQQQQQQQYGQPRVVIRVPQTHHPMQHDAKHHAQYDAQTQQSAVQTHQGPYQYQNMQAPNQSGDFAAQLYQAAYVQQPPLQQPQNQGQQFNQPHSRRQSSDHPAYSQRQPPVLYTQYPQQQSFDQSYSPQQSPVPAILSSHHQQQYPFVDQIQHQSRPTEVLNNVSVKRQPESKPRVKVESSPEPRQPVSMPVVPEYGLILLSMADEYLHAAYEHVVHARETGGGVSEVYHQLIATALACMDNALRKYRFQPLLEAKLRLRYARVLIEDTENHYEAETLLTQGIELAKNNRLWDLQYTMQALLLRFQYGLNPKAAVKAIDRVVDDVEAYQHTQWIYIFRFLRVSLSSSSTSNADFQVSVQNLQRIQELARKQGDRAVLVWAAAMEALLHLQSDTPEASVHARGALAVAQQMQLDAQLQNSPQIQILVQLVDVVCSARESSLDHIFPKTQRMQEMIDSHVDDHAWMTDGSVFIPISKRSTAGLTPHSGHLVRESGGESRIIISWLTKRDVFCIAYLLSGINHYYMDQLGAGKAESFFTEGLTLNGSCLREPEPLYGSIAYIENRGNWRRALACYLHLQLCFLHCSRRKLEKAQGSLNAIQRLSEQMTEELPLDTRCQVKYLQGAVYQASGELDRALAIYQDPELILPPASVKSPHSRTHLGICILAAINVVILLRDPAHLQHHQLQGKLNWLSSVMPASPSKDITGAYNIMLATSSGGTQLEDKHHLSRALALAQDPVNFQIQSLTLGMMSWTWFRGVLGAQALKSALAFRTTAKKSGNPMWVCVADGMVSDTQERMGRQAEAERSGQEGLDLLSTLPELVQAGLRKDSGNPLRASGA